MPNAGHQTRRVAEAMPVRRLGLASPPSPVLCAATTALLPLSESFACRSFPDTMRASAVRGIPYGLAAWWKPQDDARAFGHPVPSSGHCAWRQVALPRSRATPMDPCPALRPRWCPRHSPQPVQDCCLPARANRRLSPRYTVRDILLATTLHMSG